MQWVVQPLISIFNTPLFWYPLFFKEVLKPHVRINKMLDEHSVIHHTSPSGSSSRIHSFIFPWALSRNRMSVEFSFKPVYPTMGVENLKLVVQITRKCICGSKN